MNQTPIYEPRAHNLSVGAGWQSSRFEGKSSSSGSCCCRSCGGGDECSWLHSRTRNGAGRGRVAVATLTFPPVSLEACCRFLICMSFCVCECSYCYLPLSAASFPVCQVDSCARVCPLELWTSTGRIRPLALVCQIYGPCQGTWRGLGNDYRVTRGWRWQYRKGSYCHRSAIYPIYRGPNQIATSSRKYPNV